MTPPRPVKRTRVDAETPEASAPLDRIFITDGFHAKKPSKKVRLFLSSRLFLLMFVSDSSFMLRMSSVSRLQCATVVDLSNSFCP